MDARRTSVLATALAAALLASLGCSSAIPRPPGPGALSGVVRDTLGRPQGGIEVDAQTLHPQGATYEERSATTAADGTFDFGLVTRAAWVLVAGGPDLVAADSVGEPAAGVVLVLRRAGVARGRATMAGATTHAGTVVISDVATDVAFTDTLGDYRLGGLPAGPRELFFVRMPSGSTRTVHILVPAPGDTVVVPDVELP